MVREACQFNFARTTIATFGQNDVEHPSGLDGIFPKSLVEVTHTEKQQRVRVLGLDPIVLLHEGCRFLGHGD